MPVHTIALVAAVGLLCLASARAVALLYRYRGPRVITCPENHQHAGVALEVRRFLATGLLSGPELRLASCSRWPERAGCGQECLAEIEAAPKDCLVRTILAKWYAEKKCTYCGQIFGDIEWSLRKPALLLAEGQELVDCDHVSAEKLPDVLSTAKPVCFACRTATMWVKDHPDLIVDRSTKKSVM